MKPNTVSTQSIFLGPPAVKRHKTQPTPFVFNQHRHPMHHLFTQIFQGLNPLANTESILSTSNRFGATNDLEETKQKIMSKIAQFAATQSAFDDQMDIAVADLQYDVNYLVNTINTLQNSSSSFSGSHSGSGFSAQDQALLDALQTRASTIASKLNALDAYASGNSSGSLSGSYSGSVSGSVSGSNSGSYSGSYSGSVSGSNSGSLQGPLSGSFIGTYSGTIVDLGGSSQTVSSASFNGVGSGTFSGLIDGTFLNGNYVGNFTGSFNNQVIQYFNLSGSISATYTVVQAASSSLALRFKKISR